MPPEIGKLWAIDVLTLRMPPQYAEAKNQYTIFENASKMTLTEDMASCAEDSLHKVISKIRNQKG